MNYFVVKTRDSRDINAVYRPETVPTSMPCTDQGQSQHQCCVQTRDSRNINAVSPGSGLKDLVADIVSPVTSEPTSINDWGQGKH
ncbi:hypothetical protein DPMN_189648 [Dreissena polymorpha]|uniref:Uncharacterized protein n=1 Tax=Dreissena polymorpha TaxID=45954 RepID=A0A9D4DSB6_DREPO|nr:hypothetical protein DPMN_189648 [Dreissena polymorpha]